MNIIMVCLFITLSYGCIQHHVSTNLEVICCSDKMIYLEGGVIVYEATSVEYPCPESETSDSDNTFWVVLLPLGVIFCVCCWPCLIAFVIMAKS